MRAITWKGQMGRDSAQQEGCGNGSTSRAGREGPWRSQGEERNWSVLPRLLLQTPLLDDWEVFGDLR